MGGSLAQRLRWSTLEEERELTLPGMGERVTHPEFAGIEFLHVRAKSLLNHVPAAAGLPFEWTINVYRGCTHACSYCLAPDTPVLLADGSSAPIGALRFGDRIVGTELDGRDRRYVTTEVLDVWRTRRGAYRVTLGDGTVLVASADHRFLARDGWHYVAASPSTVGVPAVAAGHRVRQDLSARSGQNVELQHAGDVLSFHVPASRRGERPPEVGTGVTLLDARPGPGAGVVLVGPGRWAGPDEVVGRRVDAPSDLTVVAVEDLGVEIEMVDITTGTGDFLANGVVSHNCFARPTHEYLELDAGRDFESVIVVKVNAVERLRAELRAPRWQGEHIALGTNTDPYQRCEGRYRLTRGVVETLAEAGNSFSVLTKGTLVTRDLDIYAEAARRGVCTGVSMSIPTLDEQVWRDSEPGTPHPRARMEAIAALSDAGVPAGVMVAPIIPGMSDGRDQLDEVVGAAVAAGATSITPIVLHLRPGVRELFEPWLADVRPDLVERYRRLYRGSYAPEAERKRISALVHQLVAKHGGTRRAPLRDPRRGPKVPGNSAAPQRATASTASTASTGEQLRLL